MFKKNNQHNRKKIFWNHDLVKGPPKVRPMVSILEGLSSGKLDGKNMKSHDNRAQTMKNIEKQ